MKPSSAPFAALCFGLLVGAVSSTSCGPSRPTCSPSTCTTGCCDSSGMCVTLPSSSACGARGEMCKQCLLGQTCSFGTCMGGNTGAGTSGGGFATGGGSTGGGSAGGSTGGGSTGGGFGGGSTGGGSTGGGFGGGSTGGGSGACNTSNCSTCCQGSTCVTSRSNTACGFGGFACSNCTSQGLSCNMVSFTCTTGSGGGSGGGFGGGSALTGDDCTNAVPLTLVSGTASTSGSLTGYSNNTTACSGTGPDAVYEVTLTSPSVLTAQVFASGFTPRISVRSICTNTTTLACDSAPVSGIATATTSQLGSGVYYVWVDSSTTTASGSYSLSVTTSGAGGGAGGGFGGGSGGGFGGGSAGYTLSSITASCDDLSTGAVDLLSTTTTPVISDDETTGIFPLGSTLNFFGTPVSYASVQTNGMVQVYTSSTGTPSTAYSNVTIPSSAVPNGFIAPYWDDLYVSSGSNTAVRSKVYADHLTIAWFDALGSGTSFQAKFFTVTGVAEFHYCNIGTATGSGATIGAEDLSGLVGVQYSSGVATGSGVRLTP